MSHPRSVSFRDYVSHGQEGMDGLGDRDRSLSPEGDSAWDTLQTTLTPDPQPPSVGSSFASNSASATASASGGASHGAGGSSRTSLTGPETADDGVGEQPCESGCESSDDEQDDTIFVSLDSYSARANGPGSVAGYDVHGHEGRARRRPYLPPMPYSRAHERIGGSIPTSHERSRLTPGVENRGDSQTTADDADANGDGSPTNNNNTGSQSDDDPWGGMQRIVRNLARREDIPDEWWAAAGLSRTLPQDPSY
jgi:hypothetical protein